MLLLVTRQLIVLFLQQGLLRIHLFFPKKIKQVMIGLVLVPIVYSLYSIIVYFYTHSILAAIGTFIILPYFSYATYDTIWFFCVFANKLWKRLRVVQEGVIELSWLKSVFTIQKSHQRLGALRKMREDLRAQIRILVEKLGPE